MREMPKSVFDAYQSKADRFAKTYYVQESDWSATGFVGLTNRPLYSEVAFWTVRPRSGGQ